MLLRLVGMVVFVLVGGGEWWNHGSNNSYFVAATAAGAVVAPATLPAQQLPPPPPLPPPRRQEQEVSPNYFYAAKAKNKPKPVKKPPTKRPTKLVATAAPLSTRVCNAQHDVPPFSSFVLLTLQGRPASLSASDLVVLQDILKQAYQQVATCGNDASTTGAFVTLDHVNISTTPLTADSPGSDANVTQSFTIFATIVANCRGCDLYPSFFVQEDDNSNTTPNKTAAGRTRRQQRGLSQARQLQQSNASSIPPLSPSSSSILFTAARKPSPSSSKLSLSSNRGGAGGKKREKTGSKRPPLVLPTRMPQLAPSSPASLQCTCSLPRKSAWINAVNALLFTSNQARASTSTIGVLLVNATKLEPVNCASTETFFTSYMSITFGAGSSSSPPAPDVVNAQLQLLGEIIIDSWNDAAASLGTCDPNFVTLLTAETLVAPVTAEDRRALVQHQQQRHLASSTSSSSRLSSLYKVVAKCRGCPLRVKLFNDASGRRRRRLVGGGADFNPWGSNMIMEETPWNVVTTMMEQDAVPPMHLQFDFDPEQRHHRRLPIIDNQCYCPANTGSSTNNTRKLVTTATGRPSLTQFVQVLNQQLTALADAGLLTIVGPAQSTTQQSPTTNCSNVLVNLTTATVIVQVSQLVNGTSASLTADQTAFLEGAVVDAYNLLANDLYCDPFRRRMTFATLVSDSRWRKLEVLPSSSRELASNDHVLVFECEATCRGCPPGTGLFDNRRRRRSLKYAEETNNLHSEDDPGWEETLTRRRIVDQASSARTFPRWLQDSSDIPCLCSESSISNSAPSFEAFRVALNQTMSPDFTLTRTSNLTLSPTALPSKAPTLKPTRRPTLQPTSSPSGSPTAAPTSSPTSSPTTLPTVAPTSFPTVLPTSAPSTKPTPVPSAPILQEIPPFPPPTSSPTVPPTFKPTLPPSLSPTLKPTSKPSLPPTSSPSASPSKSPTRKPTDLPTFKPTAIPTPSPTPDPTSPPTEPPVPPPVSPPPTRKPTTPPTLVPTTPPTPLPTLAPTSPPTHAPTALPTTSPPTLDPTTSPTRGPTPLPTPWPTALPTLPPTLLPTTLPTFAPTGSPTLSPTSPPTLDPTYTPETAPPTWPPTLDPTFTPETPPPTLEPTAPPTTNPTSAPTAPPSKSSPKSPTATNVTMPVFDRERKKRRARG